MDMPDMPVNVPIDDPNADTEWNDILRKHGVIPEKPPSPTAKLQEAVEEALKVAHENRLEGKDLDELDALEDDEDEEFLEVYRQQRLAELSTISSASVYNQVYHLQKPDYSREVTSVSQSAFVLVLLTSSQGTNTESRILIEIWRELAQRFGDVKFCQMRAELCIEGYPDRNTPTILVYSKGDIKKQVVTLRELGGVRTSTRELEGLLVDVGAVKGDDQRLKRGKRDEEQGAGEKKIRQGKTMGDEDDSDWD